MLSSHVKGRAFKRKSEFAGHPPRRINKEHRLVYRVEEEALIIVGCCFHYDD